MKRVLLIGAAFVLVGCASGTNFTPSGKAQIVPIQSFRKCLPIEDLTKERLDCFDALAADFRADGTIPPKSITDCQFLKEEDDRLACYNGFLEPGSGSTKWHPARSPTLAPVPASPTAVAERVSTRIVHRSRGDADREADPGTGSPAGNVRAIAVLLDGAMVAVAPTIEAIRIGVIHLGTAEGAADNIEGARKPT
jgi:hypothetical protein